MVEATIKEVTQDVVITQEVSLNTEPSYKIKPRALIFKANEKDLDKIKELIETQFPKVEIVYITTGPATSFLHVTKSMPLETQNSSVQPLYTIE
jgi:hypothetical protein